LLVSDIDQIMLSFVPLRSDDELSKDSTSNTDIAIETSEALANKWFLTYNETLQQHRKAIELLEKKEVISKYLELVSSDSCSRVQISNTMHFGVLKNLALLQEEVGDNEGALKSTATATDLDQSDVSLW
jgi:hypothetical protein